MIWALRKVVSEGLPPETVSVLRLVFGAAFPAGEAR
jgi:hypothetical protein